MADPAKVLRVAHRAGNSLAAVDQAVADGADLLEADVYTWRGRLEMRHARRLGPLPWLWEEPFTFLRAQELLLADVAARLPPDAHLMLDLKGWQPWLGRHVRTAMEQAVPGLPYTVCSREWRALDAFVGLGHVKVVHSLATAGELTRLPRRLAKARTWGLAAHRQLLTTDRVAGLLRQAAVVMTWPVDSEQVYREVLALGVNAVISNDLSLLPPVSARDGRV